MPLEVPQNLFTDYEMQTALAMALKKVFQRTAAQGATLSDVLADLQKLKPLLASSPRPKKAKKKKKNSQQKQPHAPALQDPVAVLGKGQEYAQNGSDFIRAQHGRGVYNEFGHLTHLPIDAKLCRDVSEAAKFPDGPPFNIDPGYTFKTGRRKGTTAGQGYPYTWEAHHMLPGSAFYYERNGKTVFTYEQYELLLQTDYNINHGHNIIMLPKHLWAVFVHSLIQHPGNHKNYTQMVMDGMEQIAQTLDGMVKEGKDHDEVVANMFSELCDLEDDCWDSLLELSKEVFQALVNNKELTSVLVSFRTKKGKPRASLA